MNDNPWLTEDEAAKRIHVTTSQLTRWGNAATGPPRYRVGKNYLYNASELDEWVRARVAPPI